LEYGIYSVLLVPTLRVGMPLKRSASWVAHRTPSVLNLHSQNLLE